MNRDYAEAVAKIETLWIEVIKDMHIPAEWVDPNEGSWPMPRYTGIMFPGEPGYRHGEHGRSRPPCYECVDDDEYPAPWCDCREDETCKGPCRRQAHDPSFHNRRAWDPEVGR
jgi:hypothetical protein